MNPELSFKKATPADWPRIAELLQSAGLPLVGAEAHLPGFLLAFRGEQVVGCAALERYNTTALLRSVAVAAGERGRGLGQELVRRLLEQARAEGFQHIILLTETAQDFFPRFGFRVIERAQVPAPALASAEFQTNCCPVSAAVMQLDLAQHSLS
jgi:amino-acid N-acetyltransferase